MIDERVWLGERHVLSTEVLICIDFVMVVVVGRWELLI